MRHSGGRGRSARSASLMRRGMATTRRRRGGASWLPKLVACWRVVREDAQRQDVALRRARQGRNSSASPPGRPRGPTRAAPPRAAWASTRHGLTPPKPDAARHDRHLARRVRSASTAPGRPESIALPDPVSPARSSPAQVVAARPVRLARIRPTVARRVWPSASRHNPTRPDPITPKPTARPAEQNPPE